MINPIPGNTNYGWPMHFWVTLVVGRKEGSMDLGQVHDHFIPTLPF